MIVFNPRGATLMNFFGESKCNDFTVAAQNLFKRRLNDDGCASMPCVVV